MSNEINRYGKIMVWLTWLIVLYILFLLFSKVLDHQKNPNQNIDSLIAEGNVVEIVLKKNRGGQYVANGLNKGRQITYHTANGSTTGYQTLLEEVSLGDIALENIRGGVIPNMRGDFILLGMSFLKKLEFTHRGDTLTIRQYKDEF